MLLSPPSKAINCYCHGVVCAPWTIVCSSHKVRVRCAISEKMGKANIWPLEIQWTFLLKSKLIWDSYSTVYLVYSKIRISLARRICHRSGQVMDLKGSLSCSTEVDFFSSLPPPIAFPADLSVILPATLQLPQIISHGTRRSGFSCHGHICWEEIWANAIDPCPWRDRN